MPVYQTRTNPTRLYNINGGIHGTSPLRASQANVTGFIVNLLNGRGAAYRLASGNVYILLSDLILNSDPPPAPTPNPVPAKIRKLRKWGDPVMKAWGYDVNVVGTTNWQNLALWNDKTGWGAVSNFLWIDRPHVAYLQSLQFEETTDAGTFTTKSKMNWLCSDKGKIYIRAAEWETAPLIGWGTTAIGGNVVTVEELKMLEVLYKPTGQKKVIEMARVKCFRKSDVGRPLQTMIAEGIAHIAYCVYKNNGFGLSPKGLIYSPMWSPLDWDFAGNVQPNGFWLPTELMEKELA